MTEQISQAKLRLAASRKALARQMLRQPGRSAPDAGASPFGSEGAEATASQGSGTFSLLKHALSIWWQRHPAHTVWLLGRPAVQHYAAQRPLQLLGLAAGAGALAILLRPWRKGSLGRLAVAALGSAQMSALLRSALSGASPSTRQEEKA